MRHHAPILALALLALTGCGGDTPATKPASEQDKRARDMIADQEKLAAIFDTINDEPSALAALPAIKAVTLHMNQVQEAQQKEKFVARDQDPVFVQLAFDLDRAGNQLEDSQAALKKRSPKAFAIVEDAVKKLQPGPAPASAPATNP